MFKKMLISEPMTMATDYLIAFFSILFAWQMSGARIHQGQKSRRFWAIAFLALVLSSAFGGSAHGFVKMLSPQMHESLWTLTLYSIAVVSFAISCATLFSAFSGILANFIMAVVLLKFLFMCFWLQDHREFIWVIADYAPSLFFLLATSLYQHFKLQKPWATYFIFGVLISFAAAGIQMGGISVHENFNHNDLYHIVQLLGLYVLFKGAKKVVDAKAATLKELEVHAEELG